MRRVFYGAVAVVFIVLALSPLARATGSNLIANSGFETSSSGQPTGWTPESWGGNTASFNYLNSGHSGTHSVQTLVTNYSSGDAKWMPNPVGVSAGASYKYSGWYKASATTNLWAQFINGNGGLSYQWLGAEAPTGNWAQATTSFEVPAGVASLRVFQVLNTDGQLTIDDTSLELIPVCQAPSSNGLVNGGFEAACANSPDMPAGWKTQTYGPDPASYSLTSDAHSGSEAVTINNSSSNDEAGWATTVESPLAGQRYRLSFWQKGTTYVYAYIVETLQDGTTKSLSLASEPSTAGIYSSEIPVWSEYEGNFITSDNVKSFKITVATSGIGDLTLDDVQLTPLSNQSPPDFESGVVSVTLDDGDESQFVNALPILEQNGFAATFYINAGTLGADNHLTNAQLQQVAAGGNEIASHLYHHSDMVEIDQATLASELAGNKATLKQILGQGYPITDFASPYGSYVSGDLGTISQYEDSHRTTDNGINTKANLDPMRIHAKLILPSTTLAEIQDWVNGAKAEHNWLVLVYHAVSDNPPADQSADAVGVNQFNNQMSAIKSSGLPVEPVNTALEELLAQE